MSARASERAALRQRESSDGQGFGGGPGACAFATITYALAHAAGTIRLASGTYPTPTERIPLLLQGTQALDCASDGSSVFVDHNPNSGPGLGILSLSGASNAMRFCTIQGYLIGGEAITIVSSGSSTSPHRVEDCHFIDAFNEAIRIAPNVSNVRIERNSFVRGYTGVFLEQGTSFNISVSQNTFAGVYARDLFCYGVSVSGGGNTRGGGSIVCEQCPVCPN